MVRFGIEEMMTNSFFQFREEKGHPLERNCGGLSRHPLNSDMMSVSFSDRVGSMPITGGSDCSDAWEDWSKRLVKPTN